MTVASVGESAVQFAYVQGPSILRAVVSETIMRKNFATGRPNRFRCTSNRCIVWPVFVVVGFAASPPGEIDFVQPAAGAAERDARKVEENP